MTLSIKKITVPIYNYTVLLMGGDDITEVVNFIEKTNGVKLADTNNMTAFSVNINDVVYIAFTKNGRLSDLIHEINHATFTILEFVGIASTDQEAFCYLQQYLFEKICDIISIPMDLTNLRTKQEDFQQ